MASVNQRKGKQRTFTARNVAAASAIGALGISAVVAPTAGATGHHGNPKPCECGGSGLGSIDYGSLDGASLGKIGDKGSSKGSESGSEGTDKGSSHGIGSVFALPFASLAPLGSLVDLKLGSLDKIGEGSLDKGSLEGVHRTNSVRWTRSAKARSIKARSVS